MQLKSSDTVGRDRSRQKDTVVGFMGEASRWDSRGSAGEPDGCAPS